MNRRRPVIKNKEIAKQGKQFSNKKGHHSLEKVPRKHAQQIQTKSSKLLK